MALPLENCVIERTMPKGYVWAKFVQCWTADPAGARFFPPKEDSTSGEVMPAAYFTAMLTYDRDQGWIEREVKLQGGDALWAQLELAEKQQIALLSCEGHLVTKPFDYGGQQFVRTTAHIKQGSVSLHALQAQSGRPIDQPPSPEALKAQDEALGLQEWPFATPLESELLDGAPF